MLILVEPINVQLSQWLQVVYNIILHILLKNQENRQSRFFIKSTKLQKRAKKSQKGPKRAILAKSAIFIKKKDTVRSSPYGCLTSCQVSEKSLEPFFQNSRRRRTNAQTHRRTHRRTGLILQVPPVSNRGPIKQLVTSRHLACIKILNIMF